MEHDNRYVCEANAALVLATVRRLTRLGLGLTEAPWKVKGDPTDRFFQQRSPKKLKSLPSSDSRAGAQPRSCC